MKTLTPISLLIILLIAQSCGISNFSNGKIKKRRVHTVESKETRESSEAEDQLVTSIDAIEATKEIERYLEGDGEYDHDV